MSEEYSVENTVLEQATSESEGIKSDVDTGQQAVEKPQGKSTDSVPYSRFKEVNDAKKALEAKLAQAAQVFNPVVDVKKTETNDKPKREQFANEADFITELSLWGGRQGFQKAKTEEEQRNREYQEQQRRADAESNFATKASEASKKYANYQQALAASTTVFSDAVYLAIQASPVAGDLAYALATNPQEAERIASLPTNEALYALGMLSAQIPGSNGQPTKMSNMPKPIKTVGTGKPSAAKAYSDDMSQDEFNESFSFSDLQ